MENDVSKEYIECPECKIPMPNGQVGDIKFIDENKNKLFTPCKLKAIQWDFQCPKCYKIWRNP